jgi:hypothetical protein
VSIPVNSEVLDVVEIFEVLNAAHLQMDVGGILTFLVNENIDDSMK